MPTFAPRTRQGFFKHQTYSRRVVIVVLRLQNCMLVLLLARAAHKKRITVVNVVHMMCCLRHGNLPQRKPSRLANAND